jgi:hypothetical protein
VRRKTPLFPYSSWIRSPPPLPPYLIDITNLTRWSWETRPPPAKRLALLEMGNDDPAWGEERIAADLLLKVGIRISPRTVRRYMPKDRGHRRGPSSQRWMTFVRNHVEGILACDFFVTVTASFRVLYVFVIMEVRWAHARSLTSTSQLIPLRTRHFSSFARSSLERNLIGFSSTTATAFTLRSSIRP